VVAAILRRFLSHGVSGPLLDLGSGPATNQSLLTPLASTVVTLDASAHALRWCRHEKYGRPVAGDAQRLPFADRSFAVVAALDILEHLDDDRTAVAELQRVLRPGGWVLVAVPAFPSLWGWQDEVSGHRRRYAPAAIERLLNEAGLAPVKTTCINLLLALPILVARTALRRSGRTARSENTLTPRWMDRLLYAVFVSEAPLAARWRLPYGTSVVCLARRLNGQPR
jgi:SAM-dependent methyltransferase